MIDLLVNLIVLYLVSKVSQGLKIIKKNIVFEKNYWKISAHMMVI